MIKRVLGRKFLVQVERHLCIQNGFYRAELVVCYFRCYNITIRKLNLR
jgi:hypothetical protein